MDHCWRQDQDQILGLVIHLKFLLWIKVLATVLLWLRAHGIQTKITSREDGGAEFFSASERKLQDWNEQLRPLGAEAEWTGGAKWKNNLVERTHRIDDEEFYCPGGNTLTVTPIFWLKDSTGTFTTTVGALMALAWRECRLKPNLSPLAYTTPTRFVAFRYWSWTIS